MVGWSLLGCELAYLIAANVFLNFNGLHWVFAGTNQVQAGIASGWSIIPGRVHVRGARVTFQDHNLQFSIDMPRGFLVLHLRELSRRAFHASHLRGDGVAFRMRNRVDPWLKTDPSVGTFPPIPEFKAPAVYEAYVPEPPIPDAAYKLWSVHFDDVDVGVSELWAQAFRYQGQGRARGQFQLKPARNLWVGPASLELSPGLLSAGAYRVAPGLHGRVDCTVHPFDVRTVSGMEPLRYISARIRLDSSSLDPQVYALFASEPAPQVSSAGGSLHLDAEVRHGVFTPQSHLDILQGGFELRSAQGDLAADHLELHVGAEGAEAGYATLLIDRGTLKEPIAPGHPPRVQHLSLTMVSEQRDAARPFQLKEARLDEARLVLGDSNWLNRWLKGPQFALSGGGLTLLAHGRYAHKRIDGDAVVDSDGLLATVGAARVRYAGTITVQGKDVDLRALTGSVVADLTGRTLRADLPEGQVDLAGLKIHVAGSGDEEGSAAQFKAEIPTLSARGRSARLTTAALLRGTFAQPKNKLEQHLEFWATLRRPRATLGATPMKSAVTERVEVHSVLSSDAVGALNGRLELSPAAWSVDAGHLRFSGKSALVAKFAALNWGRHSGQVEAKLTSSGVTLGDTTQNADCPWSHVQSLELDATARLLERGATALALTGELRQTELAWGDFLTRADIGLKASFDQGLLAGDGDGKLDVSLRNANLQSGGGGAEGWAATVPALDVQALLARTAGKLAGSASLRAESARGRIGGTRLSTDLTADFALDALDPAARTAHGSGTLRVRNASLPNVPHPVANWWADVRLDSIFGHATKNLELGGTFRANLRDATPGLEVLAAQGSLPKWVAGAFPLNGLSVTGSMARRCRLTDIHLVQLSGGPAVARGRLQSLPDGFQGALLLRLAGLQAISGGLDFDAQHTHFGLFDGDDWLARFNQSFDKKSDNAVNLECPPDPDKCTEPTAVSVATSSSE